MWPVWTLLDQQKEDKDQRRVTKIPKSTHTGGAGLGDADEEEGEGRVRVGSHWPRLPGKVADASLLEEFKASLDRSS